MSVRFEYLYRDAGNLKKWGEIIFSNRNNADSTILEIRARTNLIYNEYFIAKKVNIPVLQFDEYIESLDHDWHEFYSFQECSETPNDSLDRDIEDFIFALGNTSVI